MHPEILAVDAVHNVLAVHKPAGLPVHVAGQYRKNTVLGHLEAARPDLGALHAAHRLDKNVSGVLLLSGDGAAAEAVRQRIVQGRVEKIYMARVQGALMRRLCLIQRHYRHSWMKLCHGA